MKLSLIIGPLATINMLMNSWYVYSNNGVWKQMHRGHQQTQHHTKQYIYDNYAIAREKKKKEGSRASCCWKSIEVALEYNARSVQILNERFFFFLLLLWLQLDCSVSRDGQNILYQHFNSKFRRETLRLIAFCQKWQWRSAHTRDFTPMGRRKLNEWRVLIYTWCNKFILFNLSYHHHVLNWCYQIRARIYDMMALGHQRDNHDHLTIHHRPI